MPQSCARFPSENENCGRAQNHQQKTQTGAQRADARLSNAYPKLFRIRTRRQFQQIARQHVKHVGQWVTIEARKASHGRVRLGITVSRQFGHAAKRNRFKRVVREAFRLCRKELPSGLDLNIKPRTAALHANSLQILAELKMLLSSGQSVGKGGVELGADALDRAGNLLARGSRG